MSVALDHPPISAAPAVARQMRIGEACLAAAHVPLTAAYYAELWTLPHYQFFPLALLGAYLLVRRQPAVADVPVAAGGGAWMFGAGLLLLFVAVVLDSPWLGAVAAWVNFTAWPAQCRGPSRRGRTWRDVVPPAVMIAVTLRPPLGIDTWLIRRLQAITAHAADTTLDVVGILHTLSGNVIEVPGGRLLVEEACSGINSLFSATACALFYLMWNKRGWIGSALLMLSIPLWVVFANVLRVVTVAVLKARYDIAADSGWLHEALGLATFFLAVGLILSTERMLRFYAVLVEPKPSAKPPSNLAPPPSAEPMMQAAPEPPAAGGSGRQWMLIGATALVIGLLQLPAFAQRVDHFAAQWQTESVPDLGAGWLDATFRSWQRMGHEQIERDRNSPFGRHSQLWQFAAGDRRAAASFDYPFFGWHELTECYTAQGWKAESRRVVEAGPNTLPAVELALRHESTGRYARLYFGLTTRSGQVYAVRRRGEVDEWLDRAARRFRTLTGRGGATDAPSSDDVTYQFQLLVESYAPPTADDDADALRLFQQSYAELNRRLAETVAVQPPAGTAP